MKIADRHVDMGRVGALAPALAQHALTKLGLRDRVQAVIYAYEAGLVRPGSS